MTIKLEIRKKGGPGSGHHGHGGRKGQRGGSTPGKGGGSSSASRHVDELDPSDEKKAFKAGFKKINHGDQGYDYRATGKGRYSRRSSVLYMTRGDSRGKFVMDMIRRDRAGNMLGDDRRFYNSIDSVLSDTAKFLTGKKV